MDSPAADPDPDPDASSPLDDFFPRPGRCKYIMDSGPWHNKPPVWCNKKQKRGSVYCKVHHDRCYQR